MKTERIQVSSKHYIPAWIIPHRTFFIKSFYKKVTSDCDISLSEATFIFYFL